MRRLGLQALWVLLVGMSGGPAEADLLPCGGGGNQGYVAYADELVATDRARERLADLEGVEEELRFLLEGHVQALQTRSTNLSVSVEQCTNRRPALSDFDSEIVREMNDANVVLEVWGRLDARRHEETFRPVARISYLLIPVRHYDRDTLPGFYAVSYPRSAEATTEDAFDLLADVHELGIYAAVAVGVKRVKEQAYLEAIPVLCQAYEKLAGLHDEHEDAVSGDPGIEALQDYVLERARFAAERAREAGLSGLDLIEQDGGVCGAGDGGS